MAKRNSRQKSRREQRKERKEQEQAAALAAAQSAKKRTRALVGILVISIGSAFGLHYAGQSNFLTGMVLLAGALLGLGIGLSGIGRNVQARKRSGSDSINFGKRG